MVVKHEKDAEYLVQYEILQVLLYHISLEPPPDKHYKSFSIFFIPYGPFRVREFQVTSPTSRHNYFRRWSVNLHRSISSPFHRIPPIRLDMICGHKRKECSDLLVISALKMVYGMGPLTPT